MNSVVIFFVPIGAPPRDVEEALRVLRRLLEKARMPERPIRPESGRPKDLPLWTWFVPNPRR